MSVAVHPVEELVQMLEAKWRVEEALLRRRGLVQLADFIASLADELGAEATKWLDEPVKLCDAAETSGCSYDNLQSMVRQGQLPNAGEKGRPRIRRRDVPRRVDARFVAPVAGSSPAELATSPDDDPVAALVGQTLLDMEFESHGPDFS